MTDKKPQRGRPKGSGSGRRKTMLSRRIDAELWERFQAYVETVVPRSTDTAVLELALVEFLERKEGKT